ncbi:MULTISPECIES: site-specific integrase [Pseudomonas]|nr:MULTISPECIES: site-specific integrase [Pseudomonas]KEZ25856.1 integrase [Pseudomonas amygdali pv. tabaci str. 6605]MBP1138522.1 integrase [Pseudomonas sp. PvP009]BCS42440.1 integrase [Pseudomonas amygdali pv. tabaci]
MQLAIRRFQGESGERFSILVDNAGMPLYYPALYVTAEMRGRSLSINTINNALSALKAMCAWQSYYDLDLESRFKQSKLLCRHEIQSLRDFMQKPLEDMCAKDKQIVALKGRQRRVAKDNQYNRITAIAEYVGFLAGRLHPVTGTSAHEINAMVAQIKANRPKISDKTEEDRSDSHLDDFVLDAVEEILKPGSESNPVAEVGLQFRNALMFTILRLTGMRRGELLNLRTEDFDFAKNTVKIVRRADSVGDPRTYQPVAKTRERTFPLSPELMQRIHEYIAKFRNKISGARKHGYLFVIHRSGRTVGWPLSNSGFGKFIATLSTLADEFSGLHTHALRHHWNYIFSRKCDEDGITPEREQKLRSYLMGWSETSGTASIYNKRHIKQEAGKAVMGLQKKHLGKSSDDNE